VRVVAIVCRCDSERIVAGPSLHACALAIVLSRRICDHFPSLSQCLVNAFQPSHILPLPTSLPRQIPPPLENIHTLRSAPPLLLLFAIYPCSSSSETDSDGEYGIQAPIFSAVSTHSQFEGRRTGWSTDFDIMNWYDMAVKMTAYELKKICRFAIGVTSGCSKW